MSNSPILGALQLHKFRGFDAYELTDLTRVNLLVGKNNCGKTSILEAIQFLVSGGNPSVLRQSANRQGEVSETGKASGEEWEPDISHFFFGHRLEPEVGFRISSDEYGQVSVTIQSVALEEQYQSSLFDGDMDHPLPLVLKIEGNASKNLPPIPVTETGSLLNSRRLRFLSHRSESASTPPVRFVTPDSLDPIPMRAIWDTILTEGREFEVINAMKIIESDLDSIHFLTSDASWRRYGRAGVLLGFGGGGRRVPLGSYGDGMRRLLALSLSLIRTANGFLLVDQIDRGLHWTVMEDMWRLVVDSARRSSVQVFATTHSYDCVRGLASLVESSPEFAADVSFQKIGSLDGAVSLDAEQIRVAIDHDIEVR